MSKRRKITDRDQRVAAEILTTFAFVETMEDVRKVWKDVYEQFNLFDDPFTRLPCSAKECAENQLEYEKQIMLERYGHYDGLD